MAQARTRLWFLPTSPRSPDKIRPELTVLQEFEGGKWDKDAQAAFFKRIVSSGTYESAGREPKEPDQPGRERVHRAPRSLGLVRAATGSTLDITTAGHALIGGHDPADLFLHQLLKLQFPSPNHDERDYRELFWIKPFLEVLRLASEVDSISKFELQAFGLALIDHRDFADVVTDLRAFRELRSRIEPGRPRRLFEHEVLRSRMSDVYAEDLATKGISLRERGGRSVCPEDVLATKVANARDYADAAMRYFYRTGLFTFSDFRSLRLLPERAPDVAQILATVPADPEPFEGSDLDLF
jgi:AlwI restriction endonuclease